MNLEEGTISFVAACSLTLPPCRLQPVDEINHISFQTAMQQLCFSSAWIYIWKKIILSEAYA
jgi:hypothetical protein